MLNIDLNEKSVHFAGSDGFITCIKYLRKNKLPCNLYVDTFVYKAVRDMLPMYNVLLIDYESESDVKERDIALISIENAKQLVSEVEHYVSMGYTVWTYSYDGTTFGKLPMSDYPGIVVHSVDGEITGIARKLEGEAENVE